MGNFNGCCVYMWKVQQGKTWTERVLGKELLRQGRLVQLLVGLGAGAFRGSVREQEGSKWRLCMQVSMRLG